MTDMALPGSIEPAKQGGPKLDHATNPLAVIIFMGVVGAAVLFAAYSIYSDIDAAGVKISSLLPFLLLFVALLIALGFEFVNGFHDTANAVATVIYTRALPANVAVVWSGMFNLAWRLVVLGRGGFRHHFAASGRIDPPSRRQRRLCHGVRAVDRGDHLEPRHLVFRPARLELAHADRLGHRRRHHQRAAAWPQRHFGRRLDAGDLDRQGAAVLAALRLCASPAILLLVVKFVIPSKELFAEPKGDQPPPTWIRGILVLTCTLVSFFHGSNDGQKGMGLIMLILIGTVPTTYALNRAMPASQIEQFVANSQAASAVIGAKAAGYNVLGDPRPAVTAYVAQHQINEGTFPSLAALVNDIAKQVTQYGSIAKMPVDQVGNTRNDMYLASEAIRFLVKDKESDLNAQDIATLNAYKGSLDSATKFIPLLGEDRRRHRAGPRHHGRLEAHRRHGRRKDRQDAPDLRPGRLRRDHGGRDHRRRRRLRLAGLDHARAVVGHRRHHGGERLRPAMVDHPQHHRWLGC